MKDDTLVGLIGLALMGAAAYLIGEVLRPQSSEDLPETPEERVDSVVLVLNERFGRDWVGASADSLKHTLRDVLPARLLSLVDVVHMIEDHATDRALSGATKRWWATHYALREGLV